MSDKAEKKPDAGQGDKKDARDDKGGDGAKKGGIGALLGKTPVMLGGVMVLEAIVLFAGFKILGGKPKTAVAAEITTSESAEGGEAKSEHGEAPAAEHGEAASSEHGEAKPAEGEHSGGGEHGSEATAPAASKPGDKKKSVELEVLSFRAPNKLSGRTFLYDVSIYAVTRGDREKRVKDTIDSRKALITDRVRTIIAQTDPEKLGGGSEPGLETLRRQVKYQLDQICGEGQIDEILIPRCIPFRTDY